MASSIPGGISISGSGASRLRGIAATACAYPRFAARCSSSRLCTTCATNSIIGTVQIHHRDTEDTEKAFTKTTLCPLCLCGVLLRMCGRLRGGWGREGFLEDLPGPQRVEGGLELRVVGGIVGRGR